MADLRQHPAVLAALPEEHKLIMGPNPWADMYDPADRSDTWIERPDGSSLHLPNGATDEVLASITAGARETEAEREDRERQFAALAARQKGEPR